MLALDFDIIGTLIFLWFIFSGIRKSKDAQKKHAQRQRKDPRSKASPRTPVLEERRTESRRAPEPKTEHIPMPSWFPFPIEIPKGEVIKEAKKASPKSKSLIPDEREKPFIESKPKVREKVIPTVIEVQESQWLASEQGFNLDKKAVVNGVIWSEILGPPRAKKKHIYR